MIRIVRLTFKPEHREDFLNIIDQYRAKIVGSEGCTSIQFLEDKKNPNIFFTYSQWINEDALNSYRNSELFSSVWSQVKPWFDAKAEAWSTEILK